MPDLPATRVQPAKAHLALRRITNRAVAAAMDPPVSEHYVGRVLNGLYPPSRRFRAQLAALLDLDETELFHAADSGQHAA